MRGTYSAGLAPVLFGAWLGGLVSAGGVIDEILIRLLRTSLGPRVAQICEPKSGVHRIARAIAWIREHIAQPVTVEDTAASVDMHASSFHQRFKAVTTPEPAAVSEGPATPGSSRLMLFQDLDATQACHRAGYLSPSQFSREYARFFGNSPTKDIARLRDDEPVHPPLLTRNDVQKALVCRSGTPADDPQNSARRRRV